MMDTLNMEPTYRVVLGDVTRFQIMIVGTGGTGSTLALFLAGLAYHARQKGVQVDLTIAAQYTAVFVLQRQILQLSSIFNLNPPTLTSRLITAKNIGKHDD